MEQKDERMFAMLIYLLSFFTAIIGPLIIWLLKKDESELVDFHGKEYINFFISYSVYSIISGILVIILIGFILLPIIGIAALVFTILAAIKAYEGEHYKIPFIFRVLK
nr:DUF4870 domain-containing protein [Bacillus solitudinis]